MPTQGYPNPGYSTPNYGNPYQYGQPQYTQQPTYTQQQYAPQQQAPLQGYLLQAPQGTTVPATLSTGLSSEFARVGDRVTATLGSPIAAGSNVILPAGSQVEGQVIMVKPAGRTGRNGELEVRFNSAMLPNGQRIGLSAKIQTEDGTGIIRGGTNAGRIGRAAVKTGLGAGLGAALGTAMGPMSGGEVGRGAIYGTAVGAGLGAATSLFQKGKPALLDTSEPVNIVLDQPLTASPSGSGAPSYQQQPADPYQNYQQPSYQQQNPQPFNFYGGQQ